MRVRLLLVVFVVMYVGMLVAPRAFAQHFDLEQDREQIAELKGQWRFHTGDDPRWAQSGFDDSAWKLLRADQNWAQQGYDKYTGFAWYRFSIRLPAGMREPALLLPYLDSYQVFADGKLVGGGGGVPPHPRIIAGQPSMVRLPPSTDGAPHDVTIAIRDWDPLPGGGPYGPTLVGDAARIQEQARSHDLATFWRQSKGGYLLLLYVMAGLGSLLFYLLRRDEREYLWFAVYELAQATFWSFRLWPAYDRMTVPALQFFYECLFTVANIAFIFFVGSLLRGRREIALGVSLVSAAVVFVGYLWFPLSYVVRAGSAADRFSTWSGYLLSLGDTGLFCGVLYVLYKAARRGVPDALLLLVPLSLFWGAEIASDWTQLLASLRVNIWPSMSWLYSSVNWPFPIQLREFGEFLTQVAILAILTLRFARSRKDEERLESEMEAAREVQQVLVPEQIPAIAGYQIQSVYKPAGQVGGDFFQIIPLDSGGVLVTIGDVSGKGMPAAMTVSLLVGTFRTLAHYTQSPAEILRAMNQRMLARSRGGFTTCLVMRADPGGVLTVANAGHISPYLNGEEIVVHPGLPLGLTADSAYDETVVQLPQDGRLTLVTDGVVEARRPDGELFGFERTASISALPAVEIAAAAQHFGQDDDITVLSLVRRPGQRNAEEPMSVLLAVPLQTTN